jgi:hypothetical protein
MTVPPIESLGEEGNAIPTEALHHCARHRPEMDGPLGRTDRQVRGSHDAAPKLGEAGIPALRLVAYFESASGLIRPGPACHTTVACHLLD